jgi:hypothetical protein
VSIGESKLCQMVSLLVVFIMKLSLLRREIVDVLGEDVRKVDYIVSPLPSFKIKLPSPRNEIPKLCPLAGESRFAVHILNGQDGTYLENSASIGESSKYQK